MRIGMTAMPWRWWTAGARRAKLHDVFSRLEFASLMQEYLPEAPPVAREYRIATSADDIRTFVAGDVTAGGKQYPASYRAARGFLSPTSAYAPRQVQFGVRVSF